MRIAGFDWDDGNWPKCGKHSVSRDDIETLLAGDISIMPVPGRSGSERFIAIGTTGSGRPTLVFFTLRERDGLPHVRPISARHMHDKERRHHERQIACPEKPADPDK